ncbi:hypothetical protein PT974_07514 [Cladobotryum mycophilum]|uniref:Uncharacterized protein n=1 Tax=Cladobotryum mycophilum TaxID=491253 RepID=A0ABR0SPH2_9HYPO
MYNPTLITTASMVKRSSTQELVKLPKFWIIIGLLIGVTLLVAAAIAYDYYIKPNRHQDNRIRDAEEFIRMNRLNRTARINSDGMLEYEEADPWAHWASGSESNLSRVEDFTHGITSHPIANANANATGQATTITRPPPAVTRTTTNDAETMNNGMALAQPNNTDAGATPVTARNGNASTSTTTGITTTTSSPVTKTATTKQTSTQSETIKTPEEAHLKASPRKTST